LYYQTNKSKQKSTHNHWIKIHHSHTPRGKHVSSSEDTRSQFLQIEHDKHFRTQVTLL